MSSPFDDIIAVIDPSKAKALERDRTRELITKFDNNLYRASLVDPQYAQPGVPYNPQAVVESAEYLKSYKKLVERVIPKVDVRDPSTFASYGSAERYYENSFSYIYNSYPYDGSGFEKIKWSLSASAIDLAVLQHEYPKETGHVIFSPNGWGTEAQTSGRYSLSNNPEYIKFSGGPYVGSIYNSATGRESGLKIDPAKGNTIEFWLKKPELVNQLTDTEVIFDSHTIDFPEGNVSHGRLLLELSGSTGSPFHLTYRSGSVGLDRQQLGTGITTATVTDGNWHHYAFVTFHTGSHLTTEMYVDGKHNSTFRKEITLMKSNEGYFEGTIGALATSKDSLGGLGYGKLSGSLDEVRFWKVARTPQEIGNYFDIPVHGATDKEQVESILGLYYKFNEGKASDDETDRVILDYSGRLNNGKFVGYVDQSRDLKSAITVSTATNNIELGDPIINPNSKKVSEALERLKNIGKSYDEYNNTSIFKTVPQWAYETTAGSNNLDSNFSILLQAVASKFDSIKMLIDGLPKLGFTTYSDFSFASGSVDYRPSFSSLLGCEDDLKHKYSVYGNKESFSYQNLMSRGMNIDEFPIVNKTDIDEYFHNIRLGNTDPATNLGFFSPNSSAEIIKNKILNSVYCNLHTMYETKGTQAAFRNVLRCFGTDEKLIAPNVYINNSEIILKDDPIFEDVEIKSVSLDSKNNSVTIFQTSSNSEERNYIEGKNSGPITFEAKVIFPGFYTGNSSYLETSIFGANSVGTKASLTLMTDTGTLGTTTITLNNADGTSHTITAAALGGGNPSTATQINTDLIGNANDAATQLKASIDAAITAGNLKMSASSITNNSGGSPRVITLTQSFAGTRGNTSISGTAISGNKIIVNNIAASSHGTLSFLEGTDKTTVTTPNDCGFVVTAVKDNIKNRGSKFKISSLNGAFTDITTDYFLNVFDNTVWNLAVKFSENAEILQNNILPKNYKVEFSGFQYQLDDLISSFNLSSTITSENYEKFIKANKGVYIGAQRTNVTGSVVKFSEGRFINFNVWDDHLEIDELKEHAKSADNIGRSKAFHEKTSNETGPRLKSDTLALNWQFDNTTISNNLLTFEDHSSGSIENVQKLGNIIGYKYPAKSTTIDNTSSIISTEALGFVKYVPIDNARGKSRVEIKTREIDSFELDSRPISYLFSYEKSMYQVISREMLRMVAGVSAYNNLIGEPIYKYRDRYKSLDKLRERFFDKVENEIDIERFIEYYKWLDSSMSSILEKFQPATANTRFGMHDVVESHVFERNKYKHQSPVFEFKDPKIETNILGINELLYDWEHGHAPQPKPATATITFNGNPTINQTITITSTDGTSLTYSAKSEANPAARTFKCNAGGELSAIGLKAAIENGTADTGGHGGKIIVSRSGATLTLTQASMQHEGNVNISHNLSNTTVVGFSGGTGLKEAENCLWWEDRAERTGILSGSTLANEEREVLRKRINTIVSGSTYVTRRLSRPYKFEISKQKILSVGSNRNANKNKDLYKIIHTGKQITLKKSDIYEFKRCDDIINPQEEDVYTAKVDVEGVSGYLDGDADLLLPFSLYSSSAGNDFSNFKTNLRITNNHDDHMPSFQGPFVREHVGGMPHRRVKYLTQEEERTEAYIISASATTLTVKQPTGRKSVFSRGRESFLNISNIKTDKERLGRSQKGASLIKKIVASDPQTSDQFGRSVAISGDTAIVGAFREDAGGSDAGAVYIFQYENGSWTQKQKLLAIDAGADDQYGYSVAIDGDLAIVGAYKNDDGGSNSGSAYILTRSSGVWSQTAKIAPSEVKAGDKFGSAVAISGQVAIIGAPFDNETLGAAYIFTYSTSSGQWVQTAKLTPSAGGIGDNFGIAVDIDNNVAVIGAPGDGGNRGTAYIFTLSGSWSETTKITDPSNTVGDFFGHSVSVSGNTVVIGAYGDNAQATNSGAAYVYSLSGTWSQTAKLMQKSGTANARFGIAVSVDGGNIIVGSDDAATGQAYIFSYIKNSWIQVNHLKPSSLQTDDGFGSANGTVSISGKNIAVAAFKHNSTATDQGAVYMYKRLGSSWKDQPSMVSPIVGNYDKTYEIVQTVGRNINNRLIADSGSIPIAPISIGRVFGSVDYKVPTRPKTDHVFVNRFSAPGAPETMAHSSRDLESGEFSIYNSMNYRNLSVRSVLNKLHAEKAEKLGYRDGLGQGFAIATIKIDDAGGVSHGDTFKLINFDGVEVTYTINGGVAQASGGGNAIGSSATVGFSGVGGGTAGKVRAASAIVIAINATVGAGFTAVSDGVDTVTITQSDRGATGNKTNTDSIGGATVSNFTGGSDGMASLHMTNRNFFYDLSENETDADNFFIQHPIPQNDMQYGWITASSNTTSFEFARANSGFGHQHNFTTGSKTAIQFISSSTYQNPILYKQYLGSIAAEGPFRSLFGEGWATSIASDRAYIGGPASKPTGGASAEGKVVVLKKQGEMWVEETTLSASNGEANDYFGVSIAGTSDVLAVGAQGRSTGSFTDNGVAYVFERRGQSPWSQTAVLIPSNTSNNASAGSARALDISADGNNVVIGQEGDSSTASDAGSAVVFNRKLGWVETAYLTASGGPQSGDLYGHSVSIDGDVIAIGGDGANSEKGAVLVFEQGETNIWTQQQVLVASDGSTGDVFGADVDVAGDYIIVGARGATVNSVSQAGAAYIYKKEGNSWVQKQKITAPTPLSADLFGYHVKIDKYNAYIGAAQNSTSLQGSVYVFENRSGTYKFSKRITPTDYNRLNIGPASGQPLFGISFDTNDENDIIIGAPGSSTNDLFFNGAAYIFKKMGKSWANVEANYAGINLSIVDGVNEDTNTLAKVTDATVSQLVTHRQGPYGWPTWKQIRGYEHPVARAHKKSNTFSRVFLGTPQKTDNVNKKVLQFNGIDSYLEINSTRKIFTGDSFSISTWIKHPEISKSKGHAIWAVNRADGANIISAFLQGTAAHHDDGVISVFVRDVGHVKQSFIRYDDDEWHQVGFVYEKLTDTEATIEIYVDGVSQGNKVKVTPFPITGTDELISIGAEFERSGGGTASHHFAGYIADFILWDKAITDTEMSNLLKYSGIDDRSKGPINIKERNDISQPVVWYRMGDGSSEGSGQSIDQINLNPASAEPNFIHNNMPAQLDGEQVILVGARPKTTGSSYSTALMIVEYINDERISDVLPGDYFVTTPQKIIVGSQDTPMNLMYSRNLRDPRISSPNPYERTRQIEDVVGDGQSTKVLSRVVKNYKEIPVTNRFSPLGIVVHGANASQTGVESEQIEWFRGLDPRLPSFFRERENIQKLNQKDRELSWLMDSHYYQALTRDIFSGDGIDINNIGRYSTSFGQVGIKKTYQNDITKFANSEILKDAKQKVHDNAGNHPALNFLGSLIEQNRRTDNRLIEVNYIEKIYPREINTYTKNVRERTNFDFFGWKSSRNARNINLSGNIQHKSDELLLAAGITSAFPKTISNSTKDFKQSFFGLFDAIDVSNDLDSVLFITSHITASAWPLDSRKTITTYPINITSSYFNHSASFLSNRSQGTRGEGILQNDFSTFPMGYNGLYGTPPFSVVYNRRIPHEVGKAKASATLMVSNHNLNADNIKIINYDGTSHTITAAALGGGNPSTATQINTSLITNENTAATQLKASLDAAVTAGNLKMTVSAITNDSGGNPRVITLTQSAATTKGNTVISGTLISGNKIIVNNTTNGGGHGTQSFTGGSSDEYLSGEAVWEAASGNLGPFYDSYSDYSQKDIRLIAQDHSIVPEFRMSEFVEEVLNGERTYPDGRPIDNPLSYWSNFLSLTGAIYANSSGDLNIGGQFFKTYSNSDFMKYFKVVDHAVVKNEHPLAHSRITLKCQAAMKFLPYRGFYPAERAVDIYELFHDNYLSDEVQKLVAFRADSPFSKSTAERFINLRANASRYQVTKPLFGPGILMNSIKAGVAVDYPIFTGSFHNVSSRLPANSFPPFTGSYPTHDNNIFIPSNTTFTGSAINNTSDFGIPRISGSVKSRIEFEDLLNPSNIFNLEIFDNEPHPSASLIYGTRDWSKVIERPARFGTFNPDLLTKDLGATFTNTQKSFASQISPYTLAIQNFAAETVNFFVEDGHLTTLVSKPIDELFVQDRIYKMRVRMTNVENVMYDRHSAFGPPVDDSGDGLDIEILTPNATGTPSSAIFTFADPETYKSQVRAITSPRSGSSGVYLRIQALDGQYRSNNIEPRIDIYFYSSQTLSTGSLPQDFTITGPGSPEYGNFNASIVFVDLESVYEENITGTNADKIRAQLIEELVVDKINSDALASRYITAIPLRDTDFATGIKIETKWNGAATAPSGHGIMAGLYGNFPSTLRLASSEAGTAPFILSGSGADSVGFRSFTDGTPDPENAYVSTTKTGQKNSHGFAPYVPPFLDPNSDPYVEITFQPTAATGGSKKYSAQEVIENSTYEYYNFNKVPNNIGSNTNYKESMSLSASLNLGIKASLRTDNLQTTIDGTGFILDSDLENPDPIVVSTEFRVDPEKRVDRWVIQTKWETPVMNFSNVKATALNLSNNQSQQVSGSPWKTRYWDEYYTQGRQRGNVTSGSFMTGSTGMWHQKGEIIDNQNSEVINRGYFLTAEDVTTGTVEGLATKLGFIDFTEDNSTKALKKAKSFRTRVGQIEDRKMIKEAIVAIPYVLREDFENRVEFITFNQEMFEKASENVRKIETEFNNIPISDSITTIDEYRDFLQKFQNKTRNYVSDSPLNAIEYQLFMMKDYILPPSLDFNLTGNDPFMMYFFQFRASLNKEDISNIWQNLYPTSNDSTAKARYSCAAREFEGRLGRMSDVSYVSHYLDTTSLTSNQDNFSPVDSIFDLFSPRNAGSNKTRWLIFKVKQRAKSNLEDIRKQSLDPRLSNIESFEYIRESKSSKSSITNEVENAQLRALQTNKLQFNWPYDYFSFVELIKIESKIDSYNYGNRLFT